MRPARQLSNHSWPIEYLGCEIHYTFDPESRKNILVHDATRPYVVLEPDGKSRRIRGRFAKLENAKKIIYYRMNREYYIRA